MFFTLFPLGFLTIISQLVLPSLAQGIQMFSVGGGNPNMAMPPAPMVSVPMCFAFPGTPEWNSCWASFNQGMTTFRQKMAEYQTALHTASEKQLGEAHKELNGASSMVYLNGYKVRVKNLSLSSKTVNGEVSIDMAGVPSHPHIIKSPEGSGLQWFGKSTRGIDAWFTMAIPPEVDIAAIRFVPTQYGIRIICPATPTSSYSSYHSVIVA